MVLIEDRSDTNFLERICRAIIIFLLNVHLCDVYMYVNLCLGACVPLCLLACQCYLERGVVG